MNMWRYKIPTEFMEKDISMVAKEVLVECKGGRNYSGLDARKGMCKAGIWEVKGHLGPSKMTSHGKEALVKQCMKFAKRAFGTCKSIILFLMIDVLRRGI